METPLISVIIPVYNVEKYLVRCIESVCGQSYQNIEIILIDDGSTDRSGQICEDKSKEDNRIIVFHKKNGGQGTARNKGLDLCTGEYITFLDSDDMMEASCIEELYRFLKKNELDISACNYARYTEDGHLISLFEESYDNFIVDGIEAQRRIWYAECINLAPWGKLYKKELWKNVRFKECRYYEDYATMHKIYLFVDRFGYMHKPQIRYLVRQNSDVRTFNELKLQTLDIADEVIKYCEKEAPGAVDAAIKKAINMYFHNWLNMPADKPEYIDYYKRIKEFLKKYRWRALKDKRVNSKTKYALVLSALSYKLTRYIFMKIKENNILF